ncbi:transcriptional regulator [Priestia aryabhattai]|uniref:P-II family nitrogen regulator n=1 Tax=Bacillaceae TaxID=186817 RepID=UPI000B9FDD52|nr:MULTISPECIES: P-II family nitrogen regulator [Bacillaceae]MDT2048139.1 P-II family nitrogen regulator [Priestia flexa]OZT11243.1 transcriptional regulator [Priestia aryabhattai]TDB53259.1 P-II family nitrogen regulator [Bacillus sp. CBEL-1]USY55774.1 P-II family nitrogen regulator [Bacillus sp. 1780r2a1]
MKKVEAIIRPEKFQSLREKLEEVGINGLTVSEVAGCGQQKGEQGLFRGQSFEIKLVPKVKVEMVVEAEHVDEIIKIVQSTCSTNQIGDGKIFVYSIEDAVRIRTGEAGLQAIL